jgi:uncharacterized RDD family membrane protein YckC
MIGSRAVPPPHSAQPNWLTEEVLLRRVFAWLIDWVLIALLCAALWTSGFTFGLLTLGLGFPVLRLLPVVPLAYQFLSLVGPLSATPGQRMMDLIVRRNDDLGPPTGTEALISVLAYYVTLALGMFWLGLALLTPRSRTPPPGPCASEASRTHELQGAAKAAILLHHGPPALPLCERADRAQGGHRNHRAGCRFPA